MSPNRQPNPRRRIFYVQESNPTWNGRQALALFDPRLQVMENFGAKAIQAPAVMKKSRR